MEWLNTVPLKPKDEQWFDELRQMRAYMLQMAILQPRDQDSLKEPDEPLSKYIRTFIPRP
jgi:hypothetical protein